MTLRGTITYRGLTLGAGSRFGITAVEGWEDLPPVDDGSAAHPFDHGEAPGRLLSPGRTITVTGHLYDRDATDGLVAELEDATYLDDELDTFTVEQFGRVLTAEARVLRRDLPQARGYGAGWQTWALQFRAPDPRRYLPGAGDVAVGLPTTGGTGLALPVNLTGVQTDGRRNRVPNPRAAVDAAGWSVNAGTGGVAAVTRVAGGGPAGEDRIRATWTTAATALGTGQLRADGRAATGYPIPVTPGEVLSASVWVRSSLAQRLALVVTYFDATGAQTGITPNSTAGAATVVAAGTWARLGLDGATVPAGAAYCLVGPQAVTGTGAALWPAGATLDATLALLEAAATAGAYFDGATPATGDLSTVGTRSYRWTGTAHASASVEATTTVAGGAALGSQLSDGRLTLTNTGPAAYRPTLTIRGPLPGGFEVVHLETGRRLVYVEDLPAGEVLTVDNRRRRVRLSGGSDRRGALTVAQWLEVPGKRRGVPGAATLAWSSRDYSALAELRVLAPPAGALW